MHDKDKAVLSSLKDP